MYPLMSRKKNRSNGVLRIGSINSAPRSVRRSFNAGKPSTGYSNGKVTTELPLKIGRLEVRHTKQVQLLTGGDSQPGGVHLDVVRTGDRFPTKCLGEKIARRNDVPRGKGEVSDAHRSGNRVVLDLSGHADLHCGVERHFVDAYRQPRVAAPLSENGPDQF